MSNRQRTHRKSTSKVSVVSVSDTNDRQLSHKSTRNSGRLSISSPHRSPIRVTNQSPNSGKDLPNLSQYFPTRKRSQSSPRNQSTLDLKYTRLKSPNNRFRKRLLADNPITYGEVDNNFEDNPSPESVDDIRRPKVKPIVKSDIDSKEPIPKDIDFKGLLSSFQSTMDEVNEVDTQSVTEPTAVEPVLTSLKTRTSQRPATSTQYNEGVDGLSQMMSTMATEHHLNDHFLSPIPCHSRHSANIRPNLSPNHKSISVNQTPIRDDIEVKYSSNGCHSKPNQSLSLDEDFDDDFDDIISQMTFPIEKPQSSTVKSNPDEDQMDEQVIADINNNDIKEEEEDDGFESDGDFDRMLSQIPNEELIDERTDRSRSLLESSVHNTSSSSMSSSGLITLSQIIELINRD